MSMGTCACPWESMGFMGVYGGLWKLMDKCEYVYINMSTGIYGSLCVYMGVYECLWIFTGVSR